MQDDIHSSRKLAAALIAGLIAIVVNTAMLEAADWIPLVTARGGLLKLLKIYFASPLAGLGVADLWAACIFPLPTRMLSRRGFTSSSGCLWRCSTLSHSSPFSLDRQLVKGLVYALLVWLANAFIVLPWIGEGIAGSGFLSAAGMIYFTVAHTSFSRCSRCSMRASRDEARRRAPPLLTSRPDWAAFIASLFAPAPREKPRWNPS